MILITGGTGLVGGHLLFRFRESEIPIRVLYRTESSIEKTREIFNSYEENGERFIKNFEWIQGDILEVPSLEIAMKDVTQVYHCAAVITGVSFRQMKKLNVTGTSNVVNVALAHQVEKMCYVSSIATIGDPVGDRPKTEEDFFNLDAKNSNYAISKYGGEMEAWRATQEGMSMVIVNPGIIIGEGSWNSGSGLFFSKVKSGLSYFTSGSSGFVDVKDVVACMHQLMDSELVNERYILVAENTSFKTILNQIANDLGKKPPKFQIPLWMLLVISALTKIGSWFGFPRVLERASAYSLSNDSSYDASKVTKAIGFSFSSVHDTVERVASFYKKS